MARDLYEVLGVPRTATEDQIKKAFRKLAAKHHPDKNPGKANEDRFKEANAANEVLSDPKRRGLYDEFGDVSLQQGFDADRARAMRDFGGRMGGHGGGGGGGSVRFEDLFGGQAGSGGFGGQGADMNDLFGGIFGGGARRGRQPGPRRGQDLESTIAIDFAAALRGTTLNLRLDGAPEPVQVRVPAGVSEGGRLRIAGRGGPGAMGGPPGDLLLTVHVAPHSHFKRDGDDLHLDLPITVVEAWQGAKVRVPTPDGEVMMKVPAKTQSGDVTRLRGKGVQRQGKPAGDLYVKFMIRLPTGDDSTIDEAIEALEPHASDPRQAIRL